MPSPIAHAISGYVLYQCLRHNSKALARDPFFQSPIAHIYAVLVSNLPDLDFLPQIITGESFHRGPSHSLIYALILGLITSFIAYNIRRSLFKPILLVTIALYGGHLLLDLFTAGGNGIPLFWPLTELYFQSPIPLFPAVHHSRGLFDISHIKFVIYELLYSFGLLWSLAVWKRWNSKNSFG